MLACTSIPVPAATIGRREQVIEQLIERAVHAALPGPVEVELGSMEAVSAMPPCRHPPRVQLDGRGTYRDARVSCADRGWQIYIPITLRRHQDIVVAAHDLPAGEVLTPGDVTMTPAAVPTGGASRLAHTLSAVVGHVLIAPIGAGTPIALSALQAAVTVHAGQTITVHVQSGTVRIVTTAVALQDGRVGQSILVKNPESGHRYRVMITANSAVDDLGW